MKVLFDDDDNAAGLRPTSITMDLIQDGKVTGYVEPGDITGWVSTINELPVINMAENTPYTYDWEGQFVSFYEISDKTVEGNVTTFTYKYVGNNMMGLTVKVLFDDDNNAAGLRPASITMNLIQNGKVNGYVEPGDITGWTCTINEIPIISMADNTPYVYDWEGTEVANYEISEKSVTGNVTTFTYRYIGDIQTTEENNRLALTVKVLFDDDDNAAGLRPTSITMDLIQDGKVTGYVEPGDITGWVSTINELPVINMAENTPYTYDWEGQFVSFYEISDKTVEGNVTTFTYKYVGNNMMGLTVIKVWDDNDNAAGKRPESVTMNLIQNGKENAYVVLSELTGWKYTLNEVPIISMTDNTPYEYVWQEEPVEGYGITGFSVEGNVTTITNTFGADSTVGTAYDAGLRMNVSLPDPDKPAYEVSEAVSFDITLDNVGNVDLENCQVIIQDGDGTEYTLDYGTIPAGEHMTLTWTVTINTTHLENGRDLITFFGQGHVPEAILAGTIPVIGHEDGLVVAPPDERELNVIGGPEDEFALHLDVAVTPVQAAYDVDQLLSFKETVTNTSSETLYDVYIEISYDSTGVDSYGRQYIGTLAPHESKDAYDNSTIGTVDKEYADAHGGEHSIHWIAYGYTVSGESGDSDARVTSNECTFTEKFNEEPVPPTDVEPVITITGITNGSGSGKKVGDFVDAAITVYNAGNVAWTADVLIAFSDVAGRDYDWSDYNGSYYGKVYGPGEGFTTTIGIKVTEDDAAKGVVERTFAAECLYNGKHYLSNEADASIPLDGIIPPVTKTPDAVLQLSVACLDPEPFAFGSENKTGDIHYQAVVRYMWTGDPSDAALYAYKTVTVDKMLITTKSGTVTQSIGPFTLYLNDASPNFYLTYDFHTDEKESDGLLHITFIAEGTDDGGKALQSNDVTFAHEVLDMPPWKPDPETKTIVEKYVVSIPPTDPNGYLLNETVDYAIWVYNDSDIIIPSIDVEDPLFGGVVGTITNLAAHDWACISCSYTVTQPDVDAGVIENTATAKWVDPESKLNLEQKSNTVTVNTVDPSKDVGGVWIDITFEKEPANGSFYVEGETFPIRVDWGNNSKVNLDRVNVGDDMASWLGYSPFVSLGTLAPGETGTATFTYVVDDIDVDMQHGVLDFAGIEAYDQYDNYYYADDYESRPAGRETPDPEIKHPELKVEKKETSHPADGRDYYIEGETITYEIILTNTGNVDLVNLMVGDTLCDTIDGVFAALPILPVGDSAKYPFSHTVTAQDVTNTKVVNYGVGYYCYDTLIDVPVFSEPVESPTGPKKPTPPHDPDGHIDTPIVKDGKDDCCMLTLTSRGVGVAEYEQHLCTKHLAVYERAQRQIEALGNNQAAKADVWRQAANEWKNALDEMYQEILNASDGPARAKVMAERGLFFAYVDSMRSLIARQNSRDPAAAEQTAAVMMMRQCAELCYVIHYAPEDRSDSIAFGSYQNVTASGGGSQCVVTESPAVDGNILIRDTLCSDHARIDKNTLSLVRSARSRAELSEAFTSARRAWISELNNMVSGQYKVAEKADKQQIAACRNLLDSLLEARKALYSLIYAGHPEIVSEVLTFDVMQDVILRCK